MSVVYWLGLLLTCFMLLYLVMAVLFDKYNANKKQSFFKYKSPLEYARNNENLFETIFAKEKKEYNRRVYRRDDRLPERT